MVNGLRAFGAALLVALALVVAGCGGGSSSSSASSPSPTSTGSANTRGQTASAFSACLAQHGVKLPAGFGNNGQPPQGGAGQPPQGGQAPQGGRPPGFSAEQQKAFSACRSKLPAGARANFGFPGGGRNNPALTKYTSCLRKHGVTFGGSNNQSAFRKASAACAKYAPTPGG